MEIASMVTIAVGASGLIGLITWLLGKSVGRSSGTKLLDIFKKKVTEEQQQEKIKKITKEQEIIVKQLEIAETSCEATKEKVKETIKKTIVDIQTILKEDKIAEIDKQIKEDWEDI